MVRGHYPAFRFLHMSHDMVVTAAAWLRLSYRNAHLKFFRTIVEARASYEHALELLRCAVS
jgi:hypothetical protein